MSSETSPQAVRRVNATRAVTKVARGNNLSGRGLVVDCRAASLFEGSRFRGNDETHAARTTRQKSDGARAASASLGLEMRAAIGLCPFGRVAEVGVDGVASGFEGVG